MRNFNVVIMDIFLTFYIINFAIWKIPENYQIRARGKSSRRGNRGNLPKSLASRNEPHLAFRWAPSQVLGGLSAKTGVFRGKMGVFISVWGWVKYIEGPRTRGVHFGDFGPGPVHHADFWGCMMHMVGGGGIRCGPTLCYPPSPA